MCYIYRYKKKKGEEDNKEEKIKEATPNHKKHSAKNKRWVVERTNSWHNRFRKLFVRYEKKAENYLVWIMIFINTLFHRLQQ